MDAHAPKALMPEAKTAECVPELQPETVIFCEASAAFAKVMTVPESFDVTAFSAPRASRWSLDMSVPALTETPQLYTLRRPPKATETCRTSPRRPAWTWPPDPASVAEARP